VAHGEALACVYPAIMRYTYASSIDKFALVGRVFDPSLEGATDREAAKKSCDVLEAFLKGIGLRVNMDDLAIPKNELKALATASMILPDYRSHPRVATPDEILEILEKSCRA
jgi:alcohol dehydrogenase class IV